jgi:hypothetical protein
MGVTPNTRGGMNEADSAGNASEGDRARRTHNASMKVATAIVVDARSQRALGFSI